MDPSIPSMEECYKVVKQRNLAPLGVSDSNSSVINSRTKVLTGEEQDGLKKLLERDARRMRVKLMIQAYLETYFREEREKAEKINQTLPNPLDGTKIISNVDGSQINVSSSRIAAKHRRKRLIKKLEKLPSQQVPNSITVDTVEEGGVGV